jgi:hypothetical protein
LAEICINDLEFLENMLNLTRRKNFLTITGCNHLTPEIYNQPLKPKVLFWHSTQNTFIHSLVFLVLSANWNCKKWVNTVKIAGGVYQNPPIGTGNVQRNYTRSNILYMIINWRSSTTETIRHSMGIKFLSIILFILFLLHWTSLVHPQLNVSKVQWEYNGIFHWTPFIHPQLNLSPRVQWEYNGIFHWTPFIHPQLNLSKVGTQ